MQELNDFVYIALYPACICSNPSCPTYSFKVVTGCIPVLVSNEAIYAFSTENGGDLDPKDFSVRITEESVSIFLFFSFFSRKPEAIIKKVEAMTKHIIGREEDD